MTSRPIRAFCQFGLRRGQSGLRRVTLAAALMLGFGIGAAQANEGAKSNGCPWAQDVTLEINGKTLTLKQDVFTTTSAEPIEIESFKVVPLVDQLKLRIIGPKGREWEAALTRLVSGKRCSAFYAGKPVLVSNTVRNPDELILNR
ncbi:hypothetical protein TSH7_23680 [Azospirillum sp. TSH7]|uniref:hypothetical protein n=1 Tax=unclassified Azospirillum TaxID=2630922 RepID=UPI000D603EE4|nr:MULTISPECIES: hypothetical protein [unclassified Azospirillum]PWC58520.1 hypothetical protein TSH7_23680 [Azospirillum sp. TSH7]PWC72254.1 hypothetical protein TSH20_01615 [Azospirillum sp. TSH20]